MITKKEILQKLEENKEVIRDYGVSKLILFGSYARDSQKKDSDIDFLVEFEVNRGLFHDYFGLINFLEDLFNSKIDLVKPELIRDELKSCILDGKQYEARV